MINETRRPDGLNFSTSAIEKGFRIIAQTGNDVMRWNSQFDYEMIRNQQGCVN